MGSDVIRKFLFVLTALLHMNSCNFFAEGIAPQISAGVHGGFEYYLKTHVPIVGVSASMEIPMHKRTFFLIKAAINVGQTGSFILPAVYRNVLGWFAFFEDFTGADFTAVDFFMFKQNIKSSHTNLLFCFMYNVQTKNFEQGYVKSSIGIVIYGDFINLKGVKNSYLNLKGFQFADLFFEIRNLQSKSFVVGVNKYLCFMDNKTDLLLEFHLFLGVSVVGRNSLTVRGHASIGDSPLYSLKMAQKMQPLYSYGLKFSVQVSRLATISLFSAFAHAFAKERVSGFPHEDGFVAWNAYLASRFRNLNQSLLNSQYIIFGVMLSYMNS